MDRRNFLATAGLGLAAGGLQAPVLASEVLAGAVKDGKQAATDPRLASRDGAFPAGFWWGAATASYQVEGAVAEGGRKPSIWDRFSHVPGTVRNGDTGDIACDHYHRFEEDVKLMAELGVRHYRFSIAWPRILPEGRGAVNEKGVDFYKRLVGSLHKHGITPHATLYHWDLPQALQDRYRGWESREIVDDFADYATATVKRLDGVHHWMTLNEISTFVFSGYGVGRPGRHAPGVALKNVQERSQVLHHTLLAHGKACQAIRAASKGACNLSVAENYSAFVPVIETPEHIEAARKAFTRTDKNGAIITPLLTGAYDPFWLEQRGADAPRIQSGDMELIHQKLDSLGFNCYSGGYVKASSRPEGFDWVPTFPAYPKMGTGWLNHVPESIYWGIRQVSELLGSQRLPIFISENGCADSGPTDGAEVQDVDRVMYLRAYLRQVQRALEEGFPVVGYFPWSLMDNFEWAEGYGQRFGLVHVDYTTQKRTPKLSYRWYQETIRRRRVL